VPLNLGAAVRPNNLNTPKSDRDDNAQDNTIITFRVRHNRGEMYIGHGRLCVYVSVPRRIPTLLDGNGCNLVEW